MEAKEVDKIIREVHDTLVYPNINFPLDRAIFEAGFQAALDDCYSKMVEQFRKQVKELPNPFFTEDYDLTQYRLKMEGFENFREVLLAQLKEAK